MRAVSGLAYGDRGSSRPVGQKYVAVVKESQSRVEHELRRPPGPWSPLVSQPVTVERKRHLIRIVAPAVGLLAAGLLVWQGSYAAFSATTVDTAPCQYDGELAATANTG